MKIGVLKSLCKIMVALNGVQAQKWEQQLCLFCCQEPCWVVEETSPKEALTQEEIFHLVIEVIVQINEPNEGQVWEEQLLLFSEQKPCWQGNSESLATSLVQNPSANVS